MQANPLTRLVHVPLLKQGLLSHLFISMQKKQKTKQKQRKTTKKIPLKKYIQGLEMQC